MIKQVILIILCANVNISMAQGENSVPIPVEILIGNRSIFYQHVVSKDIIPKKLNFFNVSSFDAKWDDNTDNHFIIANFLSHNLGKGFAIGAGGELQSAGAFFMAGAQYNFVSEKVLIVLFPFTTVRSQPELSHLSLIEYKPNLGKSMKAFIRLQFLVVTDFNQLTRSYQQIRIGLQKQRLQFGVAANLDQFQSIGRKKQNFGIFTRLLLF